jgi:hypothetical protein
MTIINDEGWGSIASLEVAFKKRPSDDNKNQTEINNCSKGRFFKMSTTFG